VQVVRLTHAVEIAAARGGGQDRACVFEWDDGFVVALVDGVGGTGNGAVAAQAIVEAVRAVGTASHDWCALLADLDRDEHRLGHGQSTAVILAITAAGISGASVGDSGAWLIQSADILDLTDGQARKPLVGSGCVPFRIQPTLLDGGTLLVASDGLLRYAKRNEIARVAAAADLAAAARSLVDLARLPNGSLQDDLSVVLCREA
jgi:serine/threonine protein phosphatase PrpC